MDALKIVKNGADFVNEEFTRISQKRHPGWSRVCARVIEGGVVRMGDPVVLAGVRPLG